MSTVWIIVEGTAGNLQSRIDVVATSYLGKKVRGRDNSNEDEKLGTPRYNNTKTKAFFGTTRGQLTNLIDLAIGHAPWLTVTDDPAFMRDAEWRE